MKKYALCTLLLTLFPICAMDKKETLKWTLAHYKKEQSVDWTGLCHVLKDIVPKGKSSVLHVTCGIGHTSESLAEIANTVYALDRDQEQLEFARKRYAYNPRLKFIGDNYAGEFIHQCDLAVIDVGTMVNNDRDLFSLVHKNLKPEGRCYYIVETQESSNPLALNAATELVLENQSQFKSAGSLLTLLKNIQPQTDAQVQQELEKIGFNVISIKHTSLDIEIENEKECKELHAALLLLHIPTISPQSTKEFCRLALEKIMATIKKDKEDKWVYPFKRTIIELQKKHN